MAAPRVLILRAPGTNCDEETAQAWTLAGAEPETVHVSRAIEEPALLDRCGVLTIPGGFSYGDDLGAGRVFAQRLGGVLAEALARFRDRGGLILGICNGFQVLVRAGLLPGGAAQGAATLARNAQGCFEDRWVRLATKGGRTPFLRDDEVIELPVAHGEGRFALEDPADLDRLDEAGQVVLRYVDEAGRAAESAPENPNGSLGAVAGLCDASGQVFGLMPHPERHVLGWHHPRWTREGARPEGDGLRIFRNAVDAVRG
jgi:phosphoribosylformylglycinamidine synthase